jgi:hypothetical protein
MAKKDFSTGVDNLFDQHIQKDDKSSQKDSNVISEDTTKSSGTSEISDNPPRDSQDDKKVKTSSQLKNTSKKRSEATTKKQTKQVMKEKTKDEPEVFINRTYSISKRIVNAITDYSYHNKMDKNSIVNSALKEFLGEYFENAES